MPDDIIAALIMGFLVGSPVGWFLKSAFTWRRQARGLAEPARPAAAPAVAPGPTVESRLETLIERMNRRMESVEDRLEFAERLLDARSHAGQLESAGQRAPGGASGPGPRAG